MTTILLPRTRLINSNIMNFSTKHFLFFLIGFLFVASSYGQTFTDNTPNGAEAWTVPTGVSTISVQVWGAGGAGGGSGSNSNNGGSGGGGGAYAIRNYNVVAGNNLSYSIGAPGTGSNGNAGTNGGNSTFLGITANGGQGGQPDTGAAGTGGTATGGTTNTTGNTGIVGAATGGAGGDGANGGTGGVGGNNSAGGVGQIPGGGGGGSERSGGTGRAGGNGGVGQIIITYTVITCNAPATINAVSAITATSATISWSAATPAPTSGYQWEVRTSGIGGSGATGLAANGATGAGVTTANVTGLTAATNYSVYVRSNCGAGFSSWTGPVAFTTLASAPPANDNCGGATLVVANGDQSCTTTASGTILDATDSGVNNSGCRDSDSDDVWFRFVATGTTHTVDLQNISGSTTDLVHAIYAINPCTNPAVDVDTAITCSDPNTSITGGLTIGATYYVQVYTWGNSSGQTTTFDICIGTPLGAPANDECAAATSLTVNPDYACGTVTPGTINNATDSGVNACGGTEDDDVWYSFVATTTSHRVSIINIASGTTDMYHAVYDAAPGCGALTSAIICNDNDVSDITGLTIGNTYYVQVYTWTSFSGQTSTFDICVGTPPACTTPNAPASPLTFDTVEDDFIAGSFPASVPAATNYLILMNTTGTPPANPIDGGTYPVGSTWSGATIIDDDTDTMFNVPGLTQTTTYYFYIFAFNNTLCSGGPTFSATSLNGNATTPIPTYCIPSSTSTTDYIDDFTTTGGSTNISHLNSGFSAGGYGDFTAQNVTQLPASPINFSVVHVGGTFETNIWVDWNNDLDFDDANEKVFATTTWGNPNNGTFNVLSTAVAGNYRMRVRSDYFTADPLPCGYDNNSETQDYTLIVTPLNCTDNPIAVTSVSTTSTTATISWTEPAPAPANGYEYIISTDNSTSTPAGDITGSTAVGNSSVALTGLLGGTTYYVFVRGVCNAVDNGIWVTNNFNTGCADLVTIPTVCPTIVGETGTDPFSDLPFNGDPNSQLDCTIRDVTLEAHSNLKETTSYIVEKIEYNKVPADYTPAGFGSGPVTITNDDVWAPTRSDITFPFCFYGETFTECLVSSNGSVTFDQSILPGSPSGWQITSNLPNTTATIIEKTIYGVFHDLDPRFLGVNPISTTVIGAAPCREFRVTWHDVPMYGDSSRLYTGMIVLHETTNIVEVFIEEKLIENGNSSPWNDGNAIVGILGDVSPVAPDNEYSYAPCRNSLDTNWETTNEAWRFTPNGAVIAPDAVTWYQGSVAPANVLVDNGDGTVTVNTPDTYIAVSDYTLCSGTVSLTDDTVLTDTKKTWLGTTLDQNWYDPTNWAPASVPTPSDCVLIPDIAATFGRSPILTSLNAIPFPTTPGYALNLTVATNGYIEIASGTNLVVTDWLDIDGTIDIRDTGSLIQIIDGAVNVNNNIGTGSINMERTATIASSYDYIYWSSPVENFGVGSISPGSTYIYEWDPNIAANINGYGDWLPTTETMVNGKGYIVRNIIGTTLADTPVFSGLPNNGIITRAITRGAYTGIDYLTPGGTMATNLDDNWNLIGNPYPSAISASDFITQNATAAGGTPAVISGAVYLWRHLAIPSNAVTNPFYGDFVYNYNPNDYIVHNGTGSTPAGFGGDIAAGQAFFVQMLQTAPRNTSVVRFNNTMRSETLDNSQFYRTGESNESITNGEKHRIWLDLIAPNNTANAILVGYVEEATDAYDRLFDAHELSETSARFYSIVDAEEMSIQGKALPFEDSDTVPLGIVIPENGNYSIAINNLDGLFETTNQAIYLEDTYTNIIHDLRNSPFSFNIDAGTYDDRFILRYTDQLLDVDDFNQNSGLEILAPNNSFIKVISGNSIISTVVVYDLLGRALINKTEINTSEISFNNNNFSEGTYIVKATLVDGKQKIQKVVLKQ